MEFYFSIKNVFTDNIMCVNGSSIPSMKFHPPAKGTSSGVDEYQRKVAEVVDKMGAASATAQGLQSPVTSAMRLKNSDHRIYVLSDASVGERGAVLGVLKVARKTLFLINEEGNYVEVRTLCVLDFYVYETYQRQGFGHTLYEFMLKAENVQAEHLALDSPSQKLLAFLEKYYGLQHSIPQCNSFVVFKNFFSFRAEQLHDSAAPSVVKYDYKAAAGCSTVTYKRVGGRASVAHHDSSMRELLTSSGDHKDVHDGKLGKAPPPLLSCTSQPSAEVTSETDPSIKGKMKLKHQNLW